MSGNDKTERYTMNSSKGQEQTYSETERTTRLNVNVLPDSSPSGISPTSDKNKTQKTWSFLVDSVNETTRITRGLFDKKRDIGALIDSNLALKAKIRKDVNAGSSLSLSLEEVNNSFDILEKVAEGGQGIIQAAVDKTLGRLVAVKSLRPEYNQDKEVKNNFITEAKVTSQLDHPSIIPIYSLCNDSANGLHLAMKLINGQTFKDYLDQICTHYKLDGVNAFNETKSLQHRLDIFLRVCDAMEYAHHRNVMHCDLKPENIMIGEYHETYIMDWGIARLIKDPAIDPTKWIKPKQISGTPRYLSPEAINGEYCDERADIYTLGLILFEVVTLKFAFTGDDSIELMRKIKANDMEPLTHRFKFRLDSDLAAIVRKATAYNRNDRYQSVAELAEDIRKYMGGNEVSANPDNSIMKIVRWTYNHRKTTLIIALSGLLVTAMTLSFTLYEKMIQAIENRQRDTRIGMAYSQSVRAAYTLDRQIGLWEYALASLASEAAFLLENSRFQSEREPFLYEYSALNDPNRTPPSLVYSNVYKQKVDPDHFIYKMAPDSDPVAVREKLLRLAPLNTRLIRNVLESERGNIMSRENIHDLKRNMISAGMPIQWAYIGLDNGLYLSYPGSGDYPENYDPRNRSWYKMVEEKTDAVWGKPYLDIGLDCGIVMTCAMQINDFDGNMLGTAAFDISLDSLVRLMKEYGNSGNYVVEKYLLDKNGNILANTSNFEQDLIALRKAGKDELELKTFPDRPLFHDIRTIKFGVTVKRDPLDGKEYLYTYSLIHTLNWFYVEKLDLQRLLKETAKEQIDKDHETVF